MNAESLFLGFLGIVAIFLYSEKMKFDAPSKSIKSVWKLIYWGGALLFFSAAVVGFCDQVPFGQQIKPIAIGIIFLSTAVVLVGFFLNLFVYKK